MSTEFIIWRQAVTGHVWPTYFVSMFNFWPTFILKYLNLKAPCYSHPRCMWYGRCRQFVSPLMTDDKFKHWLQMSVLEFTWPIDKSLSPERQVTESISPITEWDRLRRNRELWLNRIMGSVQLFCQNHSITRIIGGYHEWYLHKEEDTPLSDSLTLPTY